MRLDQFYTSPDAAMACWNIFSEVAGEFDNYLEPAAGAGAFYELMPAAKRVGIDLEPGREDIAVADFLVWEPDFTGSTAVVGNPPFGKNSSLAVKFLRKSMQFADAVGFILPRTFRKPEFVHRNVQDEYWHLTHETMLSANSFCLPDGKPYNVPCVFQVWLPKDAPRKYVPRPKTHADFAYAAAAEEADFAIQRVGANAGRVKDIGDFSPNSHYFIKANVPGVREKFEGVQWKEKFDTAGNPSISKAELVAGYNSIS